MIDLFDLYNRFNSLYNNYQGGWIRPQSDFVRMVNDISLKLWNKLTEQADKTQEVIDELSPFMKSSNILVKKTTGNYGIVDYPNDYGRFSSARIKVHNEQTLEDEEADNFGCSDKVLENEQQLSEEQKKEKAIKYSEGVTESSFYKVENSRWGGILSHQTKKPTLEKPAMTQIDNGFKVSPSGMSVIVLDYYVKPKNATFEYTLIQGDEITGQGDVIEYNKQTSVPLQWRETMIPHFLNELGIAFGINTRDSFILQASQIK